jgi:hypothetical protein
MAGPSWLSWAFVSAMLLRRLLPYSPARLLAAASPE